MGMHLLALLTFAAGTSALPNWLNFGDGFIPKFPNWGSAWGFNKLEKQPESSIPPKYIRDQFPQFNESQWEAYHCLTFTNLLNIIPPCSDYCETFSIGAVTPDGFARDGCHEDDFPCHCANSQKISDLIEPCIFPFINASSTCTQEDLSVVQVFVTDSCTFFNATQYADYRGCSNTINKEILADIASGTAPVPTVEAQKFYA